MDSETKPLPLQFARRNTEEHLNDALNEALAQPRLLARQHSINTFLNEELDNFFVNDDNSNNNNIGSNTNEFLSPPKLQRNENDNNDRNDKIDRNDRNARND